MLAVELVTGDDKEPHPQLTAAIQKACADEGLVTLTCGTYGNVFRFLPPLSISDDLLQEGLNIFEKSFEKAVAGV